MRPTGGHSPVYADRQDWTIFDAGKPVGRIYEDATAGTPAELRWFWSVIVYVDPRAVGDGLSEMQALIPRIKSGASARQWTLVFIP